MLILVLALLASGVLHTAAAVPAARLAVYVAWQYEGSIILRLCGLPADLRVLSACRSSPGIVVLLAALDYAAGDSMRIWLHSSSRCEAGRTSKLPEWVLDFCRTSNLPEWALDLLVGPAICQRRPVSICCWVTRCSPRSRNSRCPPHGGQPLVMHFSEIGHQPTTPLMLTESIAMPQPGRHGALLNSQPSLRGGYDSGFAIRASRH